MLPFFDADSLQLCKVTGEGDATTLVVPSDIRQKYLQDPIRAGEWRQILQPLQVSKLENLRWPQLTLGETSSRTPQRQWKIWKKKVETISASFSLAESSFRLVIKLVEGPQLYV